MKKIKDYIIENPPLYPGLSFFMIFGGQFIIGHIRENVFYLFYLTLGILGLQLMIVSLLIKKRNKVNKKSI
jgi:TM2 domain-containing membrane protein YozV